MAINPRPQDRALLPVTPFDEKCADLWVSQQLREAFPYKPQAEYLILDHDSKYGTEVIAAIRSMNLKALQTSIGCPWQNGVAERWVGTCRRELLDHVIALNESHLKRLVASLLFMVLRVIR